MKLNEALELIWDNKKHPVKYEKEAVIHLNEEVAASLKALVKGDKKKAQEKLEDTMSCLFIAMKALKINPEEAVKRQVEKMNNKAERVMFIFSDKVEIRVGDEVKGGWAIYGSEELNEARKMAEEFQCRVVWEQATQLTIEDAIRDAEKIKA